MLLTNVSYSCYCYYNIIIIINIVFISKTWCCYEYCNTITINVDFIINNKQAHEIKTFGQNFIILKQINWEILELFIV